VKQLWEVIPPLAKQHVAFLPRTIIFEKEEHYIPYYHDYFVTEQEHWNYMGKDDKNQTVVVCVAPVAGRTTYRSYVVLKDVEQRVLIPVCKEKEVFQHIKPVLPQLNLQKLNKVKSNKKFAKEFLQMEQLRNANNYKWGVLYLKEGQNEDQMYGNVQTSPAFEDFLKFLGEKVVLKNWVKYRGGLDVKKDSTGINSYYTEFHDMEIMYHVAPCLPFLSHDAQHLERKRHLGNDIVVIIFKEATATFNPTMLRSEFNHIFVIISEVDKTITGNSKVHYKVEITCKDGVPPFGPPIRYPAIFERTPEFREYLLTKLINGERAALHGCPSFKNKNVAARRLQLENLEKEFGKK